MLPFYLVHAIVMNLKKNNETQQQMKLQPIVIQGALPVESERMAAKLDHVTVETIGGWKFWKGTYKGTAVP